MRPSRAPASLGMSEESAANTLVAPLATREIAEKNGVEAAAIMLEHTPMNMGFAPPKKGFAEGSMKPCNGEGFVLVFDEVKTYGKFYSGAAGRFSLRQDLTTAGGYTLSALGERRDAVVRHGLSAHFVWIGISRAVFSGEAKSRNFGCDVGAWWTPLCGHFAQGRVPCGTGPDEQCGSRSSAPKSLCKNAWRRSTRPNPKV